MRKEKLSLSLSGPSHAGGSRSQAIRQLSLFHLENIEAAQFVQDLFMNNNFRVYTNPDVIGVENWRRTEKYHCSCGRNHRWAWIW
ncbi:hypothetical protein ACEQPO_17600 [Bacillus sp. SL00103]